MSQPFHGLSPESITSLLTPFKQVPVTVAFSGGVDSTVLLHLLVSLRDRGDLDILKAVHVHHGLSDQADQWAEFCGTVCQAWRVPLALARVAVPENSGEGLEQAARNARYSIFEQSVKGGGCLVMGHHQDDQAETLLLRLFRGTGLDGLQGIPQTRPLGEGTLVRPLLGTSRQDIERYAQTHELNWVDDDSNTNERFSRNFLRQSIVPEIERRWPGASERIAHLAVEVSEVNERLFSQVADALQYCEERHCEQRHSHWWLEQHSQLCIHRLNKFSPAVQKQVMRYWLKSNGITVPGRDQLDKIFSEMIGAKDDAEPQMKMGNNLLRRFHGQLFLTSAIDHLPFAKGCWNWPESASVELDGGLKLLVSLVEPGDRFALMLPDRPLQVLRREHISGNEKIAVAGRSGRKTLKRWLQEYQVPPWCRDQTPFVYDGDNMVAAPDLWVCPEYQVKTGTGYRLSCVKN